MAMEIFTVGRGQEGYPERLMPFADMPSRLFVRGALPADEQKTAAIVGARICTAYGKSQAAFFAQVLAANGVAVISGLACGIDAAAHEGALRGKGKTFAVLGCGVDICYPKQNYPLMRRMLENGGGVLSEFPPGAEPLPWHFPIRNRVISALADVVLVIEAKREERLAHYGGLRAGAGKNGICPARTDNGCDKPRLQPPDRAGSGNCDFTRNDSRGAGREKGRDKKSRTASALWKRGGNGSENTRGRTAESCTACRQHRNPAAGADRHSAGTRN